VQIGSHQEFSDNWNQYDATTTTAKTPEAVAGVVEDRVRIGGESLESGWTNSRAPVSSGSVDGINNRCQHPASGALLVKSRR
jgi:hypothetical protein